MPPQISPLSLMSQWYEIEKFQTGPAQRTREFTLLEDNDSNLYGKLRFLLMFRYLMMMKILVTSIFIRFWYRVWLNWYCKVVSSIKSSFYAWHLLRAICLEKWISDSLNHVIREADTQINGLWWRKWSSQWVTDYSCHLQQPLLRLITLL